MLDDRGFVSSCNATNFFLVRRGEVCTSTGTSCFNGITRGAVIDLCGEYAIPVRLGDFSLPEVHAADEAFVTGTFGGVTPVRSLDGRAMIAGVPGPVTRRIAELYARNALVGTGDSNPRSVDKGSGGRTTLTMGCCATRPPAVEIIAVDQDRVIASIARGSPGLPRHPRHSIRTSRIPRRLDRCGFKRHILSIVRLRNVGSNGREMACAPAP